VQLRARATPQNGIAEPSQDHCRWPLDADAIGVDAHRS